VSLLEAHAHWLAALRAQADVPPLRPRVPLWWQDHAIGSVEADFLCQIGQNPASTGRFLLQKTERNGLSGWQLDGELTPALAELAFALRDAGLAHAWRNEQLAVNAGDGRVLGTVERAVVRPLGIATAAVHLTAQAPDGRLWVQQRAFDKPNDPGLWDTLMGGMVPACDTLDQALARETWEEAGLRMDQLEALAWGGQLMTKRPAGGPSDAGYVVERIDWFRCLLPQDVVPANQDGEVAQFALLEAEQVTAMLLRGEFTTEAALILAAGGL